MSGATLATGDASIAEAAGGYETRRLSPSGAEEERPGSFGSINYTQLQLAAVLTVLGASGLVPIQDLLFAFLATAYILGLSAFVFPPVSSQRPPNIFKGHIRWQLYTTLTSFIGLFLPLAYVLGGFTRGEQAAVRAATPHLFLLCAQILSETIIFPLGFSLPVRALVPTLYNTRRLYTIETWIRTAWAFPMLPRASLLDVNYAWQLFGRVLPAINMLVWTYNLFFFLIPLFLPRAFKVHFEMQKALREGGPVKAKSDSVSDKKE